MGPPAELEREGDGSLGRGRSWLLAAFALAWLLLTVAAWLGYRESLRTDAGYLWASHTLQVRQRATSLDADLLRMEAEQRAFLLAGDEQFVRRREAYRQQATAALAELARLTRDNAAQQQRMRRIRQLLDQRSARMQRLTEQVRAGGIEGTRREFTAVGIGSIAPLSAVIAELGQAEAVLYQQRSSAAATRSGRLRLLLLVGPGLGMALLAIGVVSLLRQLRRSELLSRSLVRDIRARKEAEDELDRFFNLSLDMLCVSNADGYFKRLSPAFAATLGWSTDELLARPFTDFVHPEDLARTQEEVRRQVECGQDVIDFENRYLHKDGSWRVLSWKSAPQPDGRMYATARDVTERKREMARTQQLNEELTAQQDELVVANRELESFSYSVSHDLRAPLRHIDGYARMLAEDAAEQLEPESRRYLQTIRDSARRMGMLIDDLLAFSRLSRKPLNLEAVDMNDLVATALAEVRSNQTSGSAAEIEVGLLPAVEGDPALLRQVWINLLSNAFKYSAPRGNAARIRISGERRRDQVHFQVQDNGVGFDMRYADKLFGVFQRLHAQDQFEGTGVGLAIVQRIISRHGGQVAASGETDRGACVSFQLPGKEVAA